MTMYTCQWRPQRGEDTVIEAETEYEAAQRFASRQRANRQQPFRAVLRPPYLNVWKIQRRVRRTFPPDEKWSSAGLTDFTTTCNPEDNPEDEA